jgi:hypothetical protein
LAGLVVLLTLQSDSPKMSTKVQIDRRKDKKGNITLRLRCWFEGKREQLILGVRDDDSVISPMIKISAPEIEQAAARAIVICFFVNKRSMITSEPSLSNILAVLIGLKVSCPIIPQIL